MPRTPDRFPGTREETEVLLVSQASDPADEGAARYVTPGNFRLKDQLGVFNPREVDASFHEALRALIHFIDEGPACSFASGAYKEVLPSGSAFPTSIIWWESSSKLQKIVEKTITRTGTGSNVTPTPIEWKMYDTDGVTVLCTVTDAITYSGVFEISRARTIA